MQLGLKRDTLAFQLGVRPALQMRDMGSHAVPQSVSAINTLMGLPSIYSAISETVSENPCGDPEVDALIFYMLNHAVGLIQQKVHPLQPLGDMLPIVETYHRELSIRAARMYAYLMLICTRESRHEHSGFASSHVSKYGLLLKAFHASIQGKGSTQAAQELRDSPPKVTLRNYTEFLADIFNKGSFSSGYGGKAWGKVAEVLRDYVTGAISAEMMMDTAFTLCHNNGPIFNKGMLFDKYSGEIYTILDVQRSGQIPQLVASAGVSKAKNHRVKALWSECHKVLGDAFSGSVDWFLVETLGALNKYPAQKAAQVAASGYPAGHKAVAEVLQAKASIAANELKQQAMGKVEIMPGLFIYKCKRPA